jgi:excisionase family DNA binding protein
MGGDEMRFLTIKETAEILRVTPQWLYQLARSGTLPTVRLGRHLRVDEARLRRLVDEGGVAAKGASRSRGGTGRSRR